MSAQTLSTATSTLPRHALVVDDDPLMLDMVSDLLRDAGVLRVTRANDGKAGLDALDHAGASADLIVCDLSMPGLDGFELMEKLATRHYTGRVLLVSGTEARVLNSASLMAKFHRLNIVGGLAKPPTRAALAAALRHVHGA